MELDGLIRCTKRRKMPLNICQNCGKEFQPTRNHTKGLYCSRECAKIAWSKNKKAVFTCPCGKQFERYWSQVKNKNGPQYCSVKCKNLYHYESSFSVDQFRFDIEKYQFFAPSPELGDYSKFTFSPKHLEFLRKQRYDHYFFRNGITNEVQAYIFGILLTDGSVSYRPENNSYYIQLKMLDKDIVEQINKAFNSLLSVKVYKSNVRDSTYYYIHFSSLTLGHDLNSLGCTPDKTTTANYPLIPDHLDAHFIRGVIDGDGSWTVRPERKACELKIGGNDLLLYGIYLKLKKHLGIEPQSLEYPIDYDPNYKMKSYAVMRYNKHKSELIARFIYENATIYGKRKREIVAEHFGV